MIRLLVLYPRGEGKTFNADYWINTHMQMVGKLPNVVKWEADTAGDDAPFFAAAHIFFDSMERFGASMGSPAGAEVGADVANYTNVQPQISVHEVRATS